METLLARGTFREGDRIVVRSDQRLKQHSPIYMSQHKVLALLAGIRAPTRLIMAEQGVIAGRETTGERIRAIAGLDVVTVPGHHHVHLDDPAAVAPAVREFLGGS